MIFLRKIRQYCPLFISQKFKACEMKLPGITTTLTSWCYNKNARNKVLLVLFVLFFFALYMFPNLVSETKKRLNVTGSDCLNAFLLDLEPKLESSDVNVVMYNSKDALSPITSNQKKNSKNSNDFGSLGFVGNGRYGFVFRDGGKLIVGNYSERLLKFEVQQEFNPIHHVYLTDYSSSRIFNKPTFSGALISHFLDGMVTDLQCFLQERKCITVEHSYMFHREHSNFFMEKFTFRNELSHPVRVSIDSLMDGCENGANEQSVIDIDGKVFCKLDGNVRSAEFANIVMLQQSIKNPISLPAQSKTSYHLVTAVMHSTTSSLSQLETELKALCSSVLSTPTDQLIESHKKHWNKIWNTGFSVGRSVEKDAPSATAVNETLYHILSSVEEPLIQSRDSLSEDQKTSLQQIIRHPDHTCFSGIPNIDALQLWKVPSKSFEELKDSIELWQLTLKKSACSRLLTAGLNGFYEAVILSVFALQFGEDHLSLKTQPIYFHRNMSVRHVTYKDCSLNLGISLLHGGHAELTLASEGCTEGFHLYACGAGCVAPQILQSGEIKFPVYETVPHTPILYISESETHLSQLKRTIHYKSIHQFYSKEVSAGDKTKAYNALPTTFWVVIAFVIIAFHVFLVVLLYKEYWVGGSGSSGSSAGMGYYTNRDSYYDYPSEIRSSGGSSSTFSKTRGGSASSFISNYSVPKFSTQYLLSKSNSLKK